MIKNKDLKMGLLVFVITLIGLITFIEFYPKKDLNVIENESITETSQQKLEIAAK